jgi:uncharacterized protein
MDKMQSENKERMVKCPVCYQEKIWQGNAYRPFCSERCSLIDLGKWSAGEYKVSENISEETSETFDDY